VKITWKELLLALVSGGLTAIAFPRPGLFILAWFSLVPLFYILRQHTPGQAFGLCFLAGLVFYGILLNWIPAVPQHYGNLSQGLSLLVYVALILFLSLFWGLFGLLFSRTRLRYPQLAFFLAPFIWVGVEYILTYFLTGFPWGLLGYTQYRNLPVIQAAAVGGVYAVSFLIVLLQSMLVLSIARKSRAPFVAALALVVVVHGVGLLTLKKVKPTPESFTAGIIQGNVPPDIRWDAMTESQIIKLFDQHLGLTLQAIRKGAGLVIWPEFSLPLCFSCSDPLPARLKTDLTRFVETTRTTLLVGSSETAGTQDDPQYFNSALSLSPGQSVTQYSKMHLVPFGEYTPYPAVFGWVRNVTKEIGELTPGEQYVLHQYRNLRFGSPICFEIIFPDLVRRFVRLGADFLVNITNDGWYGRSWGPRQHFAQAVFRAVENRRFLLRSATTGISAIVDPYGRIIVRSELQTRATLTGTITPVRTKTIYTRNGDLLAQAGLTLAFIFFMLALLTRPHERQKRDGNRPIF
jgi:apolipoprotein N-acyltransferase